MPATDSFVDTNVLLYSEDLNHGQNYDGVRVRNPFLTASP